MAVVGSYPSSGSEGRGFGPGRRPCYKDFSFFE